MAEATTLDLSRALTLSPRSCSQPYCIHPGRRHDASSIRRGQLQPAGTSLGRLCDEHDPVRPLPSADGSAHRGHKHIEHGLSGGERCRWELCLDDASIRKRFLCQSVAKRAARYRIDTNSDLRAVYGRGISVRIPTSSCPTSPKTSRPLPTRLISAIRLCGGTRK